MKTLFRKFAFLAILFAVSVSIPVRYLPAEEVDFSCMSHQVKGKVQFSSLYKEYDIILDNGCPGSVYWSMCIELMDPWTHEIQVALTPSGKLQMQKQSRVNLQMKNILDKSHARHAFQAFYLNIGYALNPDVNARCVASECELNRRSLRTQFRANDVAWERAKKALAARLLEDCPQSGWDSSIQDVCKAKIHENSQAPMDQFAQKEQELKNKIAAVDRERCQVHAGG
ncbi:MAG: hypothetical protein IIB78_00760 [Proteobacteria bacterium]|nr:hypothetical protein [Pseudomonadota bacterium]